MKKDFVPSDSNTDESSVASHSSTVGNPIEQNNKVEYDDLSGISEEEKEKFVRGFLEVAMKNFIAIFKGLKLKTKIEGMCIEDNSGEEFVLSFRRWPQHLKWDKVMQTLEQEVKECDASKDDQGGTA